MSGAWISHRATLGGYVVTLLCVSAADVLKGPDDVRARIRLDLLTRRIVGRRLRTGPSPALDEELDKLKILRAWTARRLVN